jgi:hypothetical protein
MEHLRLKLKPWIEDQAKRVELVHELDYMWNTMEASGMATINQMLEELATIVYAFSKDYYKGDSKESFFAAEMYQEVIIHYGLDPYKLYPNPRGE